MSFSTAIPAGFVVTENRVIEEENSASSAVKCFEVAHIIELIFSNLDRSTLLTSRLVCHRWAYFASLELEKIVTLDFRNSDCRRQGQESQNPPCDLDSKIRRGKPNPKYHLANLISLLENTLYVPCSSFVFFTNNSLLQPFFQNIGHLVKDLHLYGFMPLVDLERIFYLQAKNLVHFKLNGGLTAEKSQDLVNCDEKQKLKLKTIGFNCEIPQEFFDEIVNTTITPKLTSFEQPAQFLHYFLDRTENSLHLIKSFKFKSNDKTIISLTNVFSKNPDLMLISLQKLDLLGLHAAVHNLHFMDQEGGKVLSKILQSSAPTCQELLWCQMPYLKADHIPMMPLVRRLTLVYNFNFHLKAPRYLRTTQFFPRGVKIPEIFPKLKRVEIKTKGLLDATNYSQVSASVNLENLFYADGSVHSVARMLLVGKIFDENEKLVEGLREMFPNAIVCFDLSGN